MFFYYSAQNDYRTPFVWAQFELVPETTVNIECKAIAENIEYEKLNRRGLTKFSFYLATSKTRTKKPKVNEA